jgi:alkanesulfonate monooxygenase SsuD/methylene tetrahydromethanopterin reductase-like flavin-dependent oxidoreductase (luciferase family)
MRIGALLGISSGDNPDDIVDQARRYEAEGYDSIWTAHAMGRGFMLTDPFVALAAVAAVTQRVEIGTAILQLPIYNSTDIALKALSVQQLAGGRLCLGVGAGSTEVDYKIHHEDYSSRFLSFETKLDELRQIFNTGAVDEQELSPWPSVRGGVPLFFGTWGKNVFRAATEFDGWIASGMHRTPEQCADAIVGYRNAGGSRAIVSTIRVDGATDLGEFKTLLQGYREAGFDDAVVMLMPGAPEPSKIVRLL